MKNYETPVWKDIALAILFICAFACLAFYVWNMAKVIDDMLVITSSADLENELCRYNCKTKEELEDLLWFTYAVTLVITYEDEHCI